MLEIEVLGEELFNEETNEFSYGLRHKLRLEHSLFSLSKWESKWEKPFLNSTDNTPEQMLDYIKFMDLDPDTPIEVFEKLSPKEIEKINAYIKSNQTATWISENKHVHGKPSSEVITSEIIYYWMISYQIPFDVELWHLNRLLTLIQVCAEKNKPQKKTNRRDMINKRRALNQARLAQQGHGG